MNTENTAANGTTAQDRESSAPGRSSVGVRVHGIVDAFEHGWGFIRTGAGRTFVHRREVTDKPQWLQVGQPVSFIRGAGVDGRPCATQVRREKDESEGERTLHN